MREGYGSRFMCPFVCMSLCVCLSFTTLVAIYLVYMSKVRQCTVSYKLDLYGMDFAENIFKRYGVICLPQ